MINNKKSYCFALKTENNINLYLTKKHKPRYFTNAFAKSKASRSKLNILQANSTPTRAFFVRRFHTPKENRLAVIQSMMACSGQPFAVGCFPVKAVCYPATRYRQSVASLAIALEQLFTGLLAMIYKFLLLGTRLHVSTYANSEAKARQFLNLPRDKAIFIARIKGGNYA
ncbi:ash family protein [Gallibacterium anatis]|uniref:ash family protein n=1 Tax=Gallibacterium anatis TaxID=750 RepID=UPI00266FA7F0|nr:ash family protein [Gallibacterium anatis]WKS97183.1 ash family protein [Gallibacterium anatis]